MKEEFIFYGDDIKIEKFPEETQFIYANPPMEPVKDTQQAIAAALDHPLNAQPLEKQLNRDSRVTIAFDDLCLPIPLMRHDIRGIVMEMILARLFKIGISKDRIRLICANGLHRKWTLKELAILLGKRVIKEMGAGRISCHDGTKEEELVFLGATDAGHEVEVNKALVESDITIYINLNATTMNGGWKSTLVGLGSWRSIRHHHTPNQWNIEGTLMDPQAGAMHKILKEMSPLVREKCNIFQVETVVNNDFWPSPLQKLLRPINHPDRKKSPGLPLRGLLAAAPVAPRKIKWMLRGALRANYKPVSIAAGEVDAVHRQTLEVLFNQQNVAYGEPADILVLGVPNLSPYSSRSLFNPILLRGLVLGYLLGAFRHRPLVKKGGIIIAYNPGIAKFHAQHHPSYIDFWENDLETYYEPMECWDALAESYAQHPRYLQNYRDHYAYHGAHPLMNWMWSGMSMKHVSRVILAGAKEPETAKKLGFTGAKDFSTALAVAKEQAGKDASVAYPVIPPMFCTDIPKGS